MTDQRNLLVAILLSIVILLGFQYFYEIPRMEQRKAELAQQRAEEQARLPAPTTLRGLPGVGLTGAGISSIRHRVPACSAPRIAPQDAPGGQQAAADRAVLR